MKIDFSLIKRSLVAALLAFSMLGCNNSDSGSNSNRNVAEVHNTSLVYLDQIATVPVVNNASTNYILRVHNDSDVAYTVEELSVGDVNNSLIIDNNRP